MTDLDSSQRTQVAPRRRRPWGIAAVVIALAVAVFVGLGALHWLPGRLNPFTSTTSVQSGPALLRSIQNMSRYEAAEGNYQVIVDLKSGTRFVPSSLSGQNTLFVGAGSVDAYVDFAGMGPGAVAVNPARTAVTVRLPGAKLAPASLDLKDSYIYAQQRGLFNRIGGIFGSDPGDNRQLYLLAQQKIQSAAAASGLVQRADQNTRLMLENMLRALGFRTVTVQYG